MKYVERDARGNACAITRPGGDRADYTYDPAGKLTTITTPTATYSYTYGLNGCASCGGGTKPDSVTRNGETLTYTYDGSLLLSMTSGGSVNGSVEWAYDNEFRVIGQSVNGADPVTYGYDTEGLLKSVGQLTLTRTAATGFLSGTSMNGVTTSYGYNPFGETTSYSAKAGATSVYDVSYTRDGAGRIVGKTETVNGQTTAFTYGYDNAGRLTSVSENGAQTASYSYDSNGNRITADERGTVSQGYYDLQDRLTKYGSATYTYTPNGELKTKSDANGTTSYSYDFYGNLTKVVLPDGTTIEYVIDGQNRRVGKKINGTLVQSWLYEDQLNPIAELDGTGTVVARFVYGDKGNIPSYVTKSGVTYRIVSDHLGSPRTIIDTTSNTVVQTYAHDAWGNETAFTDPNGLGRLIPFGFAGGIYDEQTGLTRFGARDYDPVSGRWTSKDPIDFDGADWNLYGYVVENPVNLIDTKGLKASCDDCERWYLACLGLGGVSYYAYVARCAGTAIIGGPGATCGCFAFSLGAELGNLALCSWKKVKCDEDCTPPGSPPSQGGNAPPGGGEQ
jgi:RHS repeat-associated protein